MTNIETMKKIYLTAQENCGLKVGDYVRITRTAEDFECGWDAYWMEEMTKYFKEGKILKITEFYGNTGVKLNDDYAFPYFVLEKVEEKEICPFKPFDKVLVRNTESEKWRPHLFGMYNPEHEFPYSTLTDNFRFCIPYEGYEDYVGTDEDVE